MIPIQLKKISLVLAAGWILAAAQMAVAADGRHDRDRQDNDRGQHDNDRGDRDDNRGDRNNDRDDRDNGRRDDGYQQSDNRNSNQRKHFADHDRVKVHDYYQQQYHGNRCPPGLKRKNNGCIAPGQARRWELGQRLPRGVVYYDVPPALVIEIGQPPRGSRYVRVASDILLITIGTGMVLDAIDDLNR